MTALTDYLAEVKARAEAATDGPWDIEHGRLWTDPGDAAWAEQIAVFTGSRAWMSDAEFIAAARTDVPKLVAALEAVLRLIETEPWDPEEQDAVSAIRNAITSALGVTS
jgi:hypothetical protein